MPTVLPLECDACGGRVPLSAGGATECPYCRATIGIPAAHRELRDEVEALRVARRRAEQAWRRLPRPLPDWFEDHGAWLIILAVTAVLVVNAIGIARWGWSDTRTVVVFGIVTPIAAFLFAYIDLLAGQGYARDARALVAPWGEGGLRLCRACGAPLWIETNALSATCDYCGTDSVLVVRGGAARRTFDAAHAEAASSLDDAVRMLASHLDERRLVRIIVASVIGPIWLGFVVWWLVT